MQLSRHLNANTFLLTGTICLVVASWCLAYLSGRAMNAAGDTIASHDLSAVSALIGLAAMGPGIYLIAMAQTGGVLVRTAKLLATAAIWFLLQLVVAVTLQSLAAP